MTAVAAAHYDAAYFAWQASTAGEFGGRANAFKFQPHVAPSDRVLDFGCGGGYLLAALTCGERRGVEVNAAARATAVRMGVETVADPDALPDAWADVLISNSALEHVEHPLAALRALLPKLRPGGRVVFVVPHETLASAWHPGDVNQHLYTWSPLNLGNLFTLAGFAVESVTPSRLMWPPRVQQVARVVGTGAAFRAVCAAYRIARLVLWPLRPVDSHASLVLVGRRPH